LLTEIYVDIVTPDLNRIALHANRRIGGQLPRRHVVFPTVPRTYDHLALKLAFTQRAASMQAYIIDCKYLAVNVGQGDVLTIYIEFADRSRGYFILLSSPQKGHRVIFSKLAVTRRSSAQKGPRALRRY
jgi:hypothetical protein